MIDIKPATLPKHTQRFVVWDRPNDGGRLVYLVGYCPDALSYYLAMFMDAQKVVPEINAGDTLCSKVSKSCCCQGFTLMLIDIAGPKRKIEGFKECKWDDLRIQAY